MIARYISSRSNPGQLDTHGIVGISHCVKWSKSHGELIYDKVIGIILSLDQTPQSLLVFRAARI